MNNEGFSTVFAVLIGIVLIFVLGMGITSIRRNRQEQQIQSKLDALPLSSPISKGCVPGDGVDSNPSCVYRYKDTFQHVISVVEAAGFKPETKASIFSTYSTQTFSGESPLNPLTVSTTDGITSITAEG